MYMVRGKRLPEARLQSGLQISVVELCPVPGDLCMGGSKSKHVSDGALV